MFHSVVLRDPRLVTPSNSSSTLSVHLSFIIISVGDYYNGTGGFFFYQGDTHSIIQLKRCYLWLLLIILFVAR